MHIHMHPSQSTMIRANPPCPAFNGASNARVHALAALGSLGLTALRALPAHTTGGANWGGSCASLGLVMCAKPGPVRALVLCRSCLGVAWGVA